jgi:hypothetical protein
VQGSIPVPAGTAGTGIPGHDPKIVPSDKHEGEPLWLPFLISAERVRTITGTFGWRLALRPDFPNPRRRDAKLQ